MKGVGRKKKKKRRHNEVAFQESVFSPFFPGLIALIRVKGCF